MTNALLLVVGFVLLVGGAELLVRGSAALALRLGVSALVIGLTVVAFGTSSPEVAVSLSAVYNNQPDLAVGNVVGSNTFNVLFILGLSALITPLVVAQKLVRVDVPIMIGATLLTWALALDGALSRLDGAILFAGVVVYTVMAIRTSRAESAAVRAEYAQSADMPKGGRTAVHIAFIVIGLGLCVVGANLLVRGATGVARTLGVSELIIGLTIVAAGTSLPELATSVVAAIRGQRDIAVGNIVGSNIFNLLSILGLCGLFAPRPVAVSPSVLSFDIPVTTAVAFACLPIVFTGRRISRWEGGLLLGAYVAYVGFLALQAMQHDALPDVQRALLWFALPLVGLGIGASVALSVARARRSPAAP